MNAECITGSNGLPANYMIRKKGWALKFARLRYRWEMSQRQNAFGRGYLATLAEGMPGVVTLVSCQRRTAREALRTRVALARYRLRFDRPAPTLEALVEAKLLPALPLDLMGRGPLRYDPKRRRVWSVGSNGRDDGGHAARLANWDEPDTAWETP